VRVDPLGPVTMVKPLKPVRRRAFLPTARGR